MTLEEYNDQKVPKRNPSVVLNTDEYVLGHTYTLFNNSVKKEIRTAAWVIGYPYEYCLINGSFYTTDQDGNPKKKSVFKTRL